MPKRTNNFQRFVTLIETIAKSPTARVIASSELEEYEGSSLREVDAIIEDSVSGFPVRIAIECRDYKRKQDKTWIDELVGKYRDLSIDTVVAVSSSGFTKGALEKATACRIRALTLREAIAEDWNGAGITKPFVRFMGQEVEMTGISIRFSPSDTMIGPGIDFKDWTVESSDGAPPTILSAVAMKLYREHSHVAAEEYIRDNDLLKPETREETEFEFSIVFAVAGQELVSPEGLRRTITELVLRVKGKVRYIDAQHSHFSYARKLATVATINGPLVGTHSVVLVQMPKDSPDTIRWAHAHVPPQEPVPADD